jgi:hypothetical protein
LIPVSNDRYVNVELERTFMKRIFLITLLCIFTGVLALAQADKKPTFVITDTQWKELITALKSENWESAFALSSDYMKLMKEDDEMKTLARLRYMYLYSAAGKVSEDKMSFETLEKTVKDFVGKEILAPYRKIKLDCRGEFNFICPSEENKKRTMTTAANKPGTSIFAFEYADLKETVDFARNSGKQAAVGGIVKDIVPNPNKTTIVIMRIYISDGYIKLPEPGH